MPNIPVITPTPSASDNTDTSVKTGLLKRPRMAYRTSFNSHPSQSHPHTSRVCSLIRVELPKARRAANRASSGGTPCSRCSSSSSSRSDCSSRSTSASRFLICHHLISALLSPGPHYASDSFHHLLPLRFLDRKLFSALFRKSVILEFPIAIRSHFPLGGDPSPSL